MPAPSYSPRRKCIGPDEKFGLRITAAERKLILGGNLDDDHAEAIRQILGNRPVEFTLDDWDYLATKLATQARQTEDKAMRKELWGIYMKINRTAHSSGRKGRSLMRGKPHRRT